MISKDETSFFAKTNHRNSNLAFGIKQTDRLSHTYIIGKTGTGKTTLLETKMVQDVKSGRGFSLIDPHGDLVECIHQNIQNCRKDDVIYVNAPDHLNPWGYNPFKKVRQGRRALVASGLIEVFKKQFDRRSWGVKMEHILRNAALTLLDQPKADISDLLRLFNDYDYRNRAIESIENPYVKDFWINEYDKYPPYYRATAIAPIQNKIGAFLANPTIVSMLVRYKKEIKLRQAIDENKFILINLAKGQIGEDTAGLLGGIFLTSLGLAAFSRADIEEKNRIPHIVYVDEFQNFSTLSLINLLSELRKYKVGLVLANQYLQQIDTDIREAVLGNVGTFISFRLGANDALYMAKEFYPVFKREDFINLPNYYIYLRLMIDGAPSKPFSAVTVTRKEI